MFGFTRIGPRSKPDPAYETAKVISIDGKPVEPMSIWRAIGAFQDEDKPTDADLTVRRMRKSMSIPR